MQFFVEDLGLALAPKMRPEQSQAFKEVNNRKAFDAARGKKKYLNELLPGAPRHACTKFVSR